MFQYPGGKKKQPYVPTPPPSHHQHHRPHPPPSSSNHPPPSLTNLSAWFDHYDRDNNNRLSRVEVVSALIQTLELPSYKQPSLRETVFSVWPAFDHDGSGYIDKQEFCARGGLGESLVAMVNSESSRPSAPPSEPSFSVQPSAPSAPAQDDSWRCPKCTFQNPSQRSNCEMCGAASLGASSSHSSSRQSHTAQQAMRVRIPPGMGPGQKLKVRSQSGDESVVTVPDRSKWVTVQGAPCFDVRIPTIQATVIHATTTPTQPFQSWTHFNGRSYHPPPLGMTSVPHSLSPLPIPPSGRRKALLIGINYTNTRAELRGCVNDAHNIQRLLLQNGFPDDSSHMVLLTDQRYGNYSPTGETILKAMQWLVQGVSEGDVLFFHFSGHGAQVPDPTGHEADGLNETILPLDYKKKQITDDVLWGSLVYPLPSGVRLTAIMDCCHSGTGLDLPYEYKHREGRWIEDVNPAHSKGDVMLFSGCEDSQTSADTNAGFQAGGAMTQSFIAAYQQNAMMTYSELLEAIHAHLKRRRFTQRPQLTSSQKFDARRRVFSFVEGIESNKNMEVGRLKRRHIKPGKAGNQAMNDLLFGAAGVAAGAMMLADLFF